MLLLPRGSSWAGGCLLTWWCHYRPHLTGPRGHGLTFTSAHTYKLLHQEKFSFLSRCCQGFHTSQLTVPLSPGSKWVLRNFNISFLPFPSPFLSCIPCSCLFPQDTYQLESLVPQLWGHRDRISHDSDMWSNFWAGCSSVILTYCGGRNNMSDTLPKRANTGAQWLILRCKDWGALPLGVQPAELEDLGVCSCTSSQDIVL